ncbi:MAG TPA: flavin reductase family protein [Anaerolineales bacterium]|jgi:flavin reductase (DIM6/NTAB) family NADH-FMN oxidoreductase RutF
MKTSGSTKIIVSPDPDNLRAALRFWTTGITIVAASHADVMHGMTVNSFTSLSLVPPLVSISLEKVTRTYQLVVSSGVFAATILSEDQRSLSDRFAGLDSEQSNRFEGLETFTLGTGSPILSQGLAFFDCRVLSLHDAGTHTVFISEVAACGRFSDSADQQPLVYFNRGYRKIVKS